jgi:hypothetical protein
MENEEILKNAHQDYVDWWLPIDVAGDSFLAPMSYDIFLERLLTYPHEEWFARWIGDEIPSDKITAFKTFIFRLLIFNHVNNSKQIND